VKLIVLPVLKISGGARSISDAAEVRESAVCE
jgi:hypothetical protein